MSTVTALEEGTLSFTIESRVLRELGERLVKQPEVAVVELIKNSYDADATECSVKFDRTTSLTVSDDGVGMTLSQFIRGWMTIGTSVKVPMEHSDRFSRPITGEKGIGRFAVRFLGRQLTLISVADDEVLGQRTLLTAEFDWDQFDEQADLGQILVPYRLESAPSDTRTGTVLLITKLRSQTSRLNVARVRTESIGILSPVSSLLRELEHAAGVEDSRLDDPGFRLLMEPASDHIHEDVASAILANFVLRATVQLSNGRVRILVFQHGKSKPYLSINDRFPSDVGSVSADIRFFPRRKGAFAGSPVDGRQAYSWIKENSGVAVFDRDFRVQPYGSSGDDWLRLAEDTARNTRDPRSTIAEKHFPMSPEERGSTSLNWMLKLPQSLQLIGVVRVQGRRAGVSKSGDGVGLVASADREGFVDNESFERFQDLIRGAVEALAFCDKKIQVEDAEREARAVEAMLEEETQEAIAQVSANPAIPARDKERIVAVLLQSQTQASDREQAARERERQLEIMSLLGVVAGFMTHEFGAALHDLREAQELLRGTQLKRTPAIVKINDDLTEHIKKLTDFVTYSSGYIAGSKTEPAKPYPVRPRIKQVLRVFGAYANERGIEIDLAVESDLMAPLVPVSLYNGVALNLYTNALKAVTSRLGKGPRLIAFRAWNDETRHTLEVSDNGVGIPEAIRERVFDPLFTTTNSRSDPLGSGMGLGLTLVRRGVAAFRGRVDIVEPPPGFSTCVRVTLPLQVDSK